MDDKDHLWGRCYSAQHADQFEVQDHMQEQGEKMTKIYIRDNIDPRKNGFDNIKQDSQMMVINRGKTFDQSKSLYSQQKAKLSSAWRDSLGKVNADAPQPAQQASLDGLTPYERLKQQRSLAWRK